MARRTEGCLIVAFLLAIAIATIIVRSLRAGERALQEGVDRAEDAVSDAGSRVSEGISQSLEGIEEAGAKGAQALRDRRTETDSSDE